MMKPRLFLRIALATLALLILAIGSWQIAQYRLLERWWFNTMHSDQGYLGGYIAAIQGKPVTDGDSLSSLTYNPLTGTLFTVGDDRPEILELKVSGEVVRRIPLKGFIEVEGIEYISGNQFLLLEEQPFNRLSIIEIDEDTTAVDSFVSRFSYSVDLTNNKNWEGLTFSPGLNRIYTGKERGPVAIYEIDGLIAPRTPPDIMIRNNPQRDRGLFIKDLSGLAIAHGTENLLVLSHESRLVIELDNNGLPISTLSLRKGKNGLNHSIPQAEGIAVGPDGTLYIMSEPNLFYAFVKTDTK